MLVKLWFLATLLLVALLLGTTFAHTLEMPAKLQYDGRQWMLAQHTLYRAFATVGAPIEAGAIIASIVLAFLLRHERLPFILAGAAVVSLAIAFFAIWIFITNVVNAETTRWTAETIPVDWSEWRLRWEYSHASRFVLHLIAFILLTTAMLVRIPAG